MNIFQALQCPVAEEIKELNKELYGDELSTEPSDCIKGAGEKHVMDVVKQHIIITRMEAARNIVDSQKSNTHKHDDHTMTSEEPSGNDTHMGDLDRAQGETTGNDARIDYSDNAQGERWYNVLERASSFLRQTIMTAVDNCAIQIEEKLKSNSDLNFSLPDVQIPTANPQHINFALSQLATLVRNIGNTTPPPTPPDVNFTELAKKPSSDMSYATHALKLESYYIQCADWVSKLPSCATL